MSEGQLSSSLKKAVQDRIMNEILIDHEADNGAWKVLILDELTTRVLSSAVKMSDVLERNVSVVEDLHKERQPLPGQAAVYFIQPTSRNIERVLHDFSGPKGLYSSVHIFFSSQVRPKLIDKIKDCPPLLRCIKTLKEGNLEVVSVDSRTVTTEHPDSLLRLMGPGADNRSRSSDLSTFVSRLSTLFATLKDFPVIRYSTLASDLQQQGPFLGVDGQPLPGADGRGTLTMRVGMALHDRLTVMQKAGVLPSKETCDLIILDRSYDPLAPVIHEWTYESMVHDFLQERMDGNLYKYMSETGGGKPAEKESSIDERDPMWLELRHLFIAEVYAAIATKFKEFQSKNKAAKVVGAGGTGKAGEMGLGSMKALIAALPQYQDILTRMSLHIQVSSDLKAVTNERGLTDVGELEQDLIFGDKASKDLITFLTDNHDKLDKLDKMRLFMCYLVTHPEKLDAAKMDQWVKLGGLSGKDMEAICSLAYLGVQVMNPPQAPEAGGSSKGFFGGKKEKKEKEKLALRKAREEEEGYALFRFEPLLRSILTNLAQNKLSSSEYPYVKPPSKPTNSEADSNVASARVKPSLTWAKREGGAGSSSSSSGKKLIVCLVGGVVRSEMRIVHQLSEALGRDILLVSSSVETPKSFIDQLRAMGVNEASED